VKTREHTQKGKRRLAVTKEAMQNEVKPINQTTINGGRSKKNKFTLLQAMHRFKRLNRRFRIENVPGILNELIELDRYIAENNIKWVRTYSA